MSWFFLSVLALIVLTSCDSLKDSIGLGRNQPDEFKTPINPPLSVPKDLSLPPPQQAETTAPEKQGSKIQDILFKDKAPSQIPSNSNTIPLPTSEQSTPNIRAIIDAEEKGKSS